MIRRIDDATPHHESLRHHGSGGCSEASRALGFRPAFFDFATCAIHLSRFADGRLAPIHLLDGLPEEAVLIRSSSGRVMAARSSIVAGFERLGFFYTRTAAARALAEWAVSPPPAG